jgi:hypothetical protein
MKVRAKAQRAPSNSLGFASFSPLRELVAGQETLSMDRTNHYEAAFEAYLQWHRLGYLAIDESRRAMLGDTSVKSLDFVVYGNGDARFLVDVKGRRFPTGAPGRRRRVWECWSTREDVVDLVRWQERFGPGFRGLFVFMYQLLPEVELAADTDDLWTWRGRRYLLRAVAVDEYEPHMRVRSPRWQTVTLPRPLFRRLVRPFHHFTDGNAAERAPGSIACPAFGPYT